MNNKYFGNALDLFKYDILEHLAVKDNRFLFYAPMLTAPQLRQHDPKYYNYEIGGKNIFLLSFLKEAFQSNTELEVKHIRDYFKEAKINYSMVVEETDDDVHSFSLNNIKFFNDQNREDYFSGVIAKFKQITIPSLFFIDPDVGLSNKIVRRVRSMRERYLLNDELKAVLKNIKKDDWVCYFQHLGNHNYSLENRILELKLEFGENIILFGYKRILGSLVFITQNNIQLNRLKNLLEEYKEGYRGMENFEKIILEY